MVLLLTPFSPLLTLTDRCKGATRRSWKGERVNEENRSELRRDPIVDRWVIIAKERARRPFQYSREPVVSAPGKFCPFCPGNEEKTPPEILAFRAPQLEDNYAGWWVRVVPNKFPALTRDEEEPSCEIGLYDRMAGFGEHEVIVETPLHNAHFADYSQYQVQEILWIYRERILSLRADRRLQYILIFKNHGREAGASIEHPHTQLIATPIVPKRVKEELSGSERYFGQFSRCVFCDMLAEEHESRLRMVEETERFVAFCPFAARFPFETWILPRQHRSHFDAIDEADIHDLARCLWRVLARIRAVLGDVPYNYILHTAPCQDAPQPYFHWHLEIMPKMTKIAGFEWGTGFFINPTPPELAAAQLATADLSGETRPAAEAVSD